MTEQEYRQHPAVNKSTLWEMRKSPAHYKYALEHPREDTPALRFGRALHMAVLEPEAFKQHYVLMPEIDRRTKAGKEEYQRFMEYAGDREIISHDDYEAILGMHDAIWADQDAADLLDGCQTEQPVFWTDDATGIECKCRIDACKPGVVIDLKTCESASTEAFKRDALRLGYDVQAAHYLRGYRAHFGRNADWYFIAVEKKPPYAVNVIHATDDFVDRGTWILIDLMDKLKECRDKDTWLGYGRNELVLNEWEAIPDEVE